MTNMTNLNDATFALTDAELDLVAGGLNPQPLPPGPPPPEAGRSFNSIFHGFGINQHFNFNFFRQFEF
jgi:hypothetical protein